MTIAAEMLAAVAAATTTVPVVGARVVMANSLVTASRGTVTSVSPLGYYTVAWDLPGFADQTYSPAAAGSLHRFMEVEG